MEGRESEAEEVGAGEYTGVLAEVCGGTVLGRKLVEFARDPCRTKETTKDLKNDDVLECGSDDDKLRALVDRNFFIAKQESLEAQDGGVELTVEELEERFFFFFFNSLLACSI